MVAVARKVVSSRGSKGRRESEPVVEKGTVEPAAVASHETNEELAQRAGSFRECKRDQSLVRHVLASCEQVTKKVSASKQW